MKQGVLVTWIFVEFDWHIASVQYAYKIQSAKRKERKKKEKRRRRKRRRKEGEAKKKKKKKKQKKKGVAKYSATVVSFQEKIPFINK